MPQPGIRTPKRTIQSSETANPAYHQHDFSDRTWQTIAHPHRPGKVGRPAQDNRRHINTVFRILRTGAFWRGLPQITGTGTLPTAASDAGSGTDTGPACWPPCPITLTWSG